MGGQESGGQDVPVSTAESGVFAGATTTIRPEDAGDFKANTLVTLENLPAFLQAAGLGESLSVPGWSEQVASAARITERGRTARQVCDELTAAGSREMAQKLMAVLNRDSI